jgi:AcrR family transcriptional regulator
MERKRREDRRKLKTRQALLQTAASVLAKNGYHQTLISDIVREARMRQGTFYRYFKDKRDIFAQLTEEFIERLAAEFSPMSDHLPLNVHEYHDMSLNAIRRVMTIALGNYDLVRLIVREGPTIDPEFARVVDDFFNRFARLAQSFLEYAIAQGFARPCRAEVISQAIIGVALRLTDSGMQGQLKDLPKMVLVEEAVDFAFRGFGLYEDSSANTPRQAD